MTGLLTMPHLNQADRLVDRLDELVQQLAKNIPSGYLPDYVPALAQANSQAFGAALRAIDGRTWSRSRPRQPLVLMSVVKPLLLLYALRILGIDPVRSLLDCQPSALPYNDLSQLLEDGGRPRNAMLNSGAIALAGLIPGRNARDRVRLFQRWCYETWGLLLPVNETLCASVQSLPNQHNQAIAQTLVQFGTLEDATLALDTYNRICCTTLTLPDLASLGCWLAEPLDDWAEAIAEVLDMMAVGGLYQQSPDWMERVGWPAKSSVSGLVWAVQPGVGAIACYSPPLDDQGNSLLGLAFVRRAIDWF
ncbi:MAG: glutaminase A [Oscillatoriales cyanobacterium]|nr:MAG: glutaminase A [Oscillatoriales cyanobacterium]